MQRHLPARASGRQDTPGVNIPHLVSDRAAFAGAARQAALLRARDMTATELTELYLRRIDALDPRLNAFRVVYRERALAEAAQADARLRAGEERPLLGVPIAVKDNMDVAGDVSAHGSGAPVPPAAADSEVVRRLRAAGAVVIGKTHLSELAVFPFGESAAWGVTRNPWSTGHTTGGSSAGSAAAVAAGLAAAALGSDGGGSIRIPAACCHLFGIKPQRGRIPLAPLPEHWHGLSTLGPITRTVADAALLLDVLAGSAPGDADTPPPPPSPYAQALDSDPRPLRIAVSFKPPTPGPVSEAVRRPVRELGDLLRTLGHQVSEHEPDYGETRHLFGPRWLRGIYDDSRTIVPDPRRLERRTRQMAAAGRLIGADMVARARRAEAALNARLASTFDSFDVLLTPALAKPPVEAGRWQGRSAARTVLGVGMFVPFSPVWNLTGQPAASLPAGFGEDGLPLAVQAVARSNDEHTLLALAAQVERERRWADSVPPLA
jgi:amidase